jgi:hypothetical protein
LNKLKYLYKKSLIIIKTIKENSFYGIKKLNLDSSRFYIFEKGSIEDYYPVELVMKALKDLFRIEIKEDEIDLGIPMDKAIERILDKYS